MDTQLRRLATEDTLEGISQKLGRLGHLSGGSNFQYLTERAPAPGVLQDHSKPALFVHYTRSQDRSGDQESVSSTILAALGEGSKRPSTSKDTVQHHHDADSVNDSADSDSQFSNFDRKRMLYESLIDSILAEVDMSTVTLA